MIERDWVTKAGLRAVCYVSESQGFKSHRCGYVAVPTGHPLHGCGYHEQHALLTLVTAVGAGGESDIKRTPDVAFRCHGGLSYAGGGEFPVPSDSWWFGFDCHHTGDGNIEEPPEKYPEGGVLRMSNYREVVRTQEYVEAECESLAAQIVDVFTDQH